MFGAKTSYLKPMKALPIASVGRIRALKGCCLLATLPNAAIGDACSITKRDGSSLSAEVVSFNENTVVLAPFDEIAGIGPNAEVYCHGEPLLINLPRKPLGQVLDALGLPLWEQKPTNQDTQYKRITVRCDPPSPTSRPRINRQMLTGVKLIDLFTPVGYGQRLGISASAGAGKSSLLGMITRNAEVDAVVVGLVGERGREVNDFIFESLGEQGLARATLVVSTSNETPLRRLMAPQTATAIAESLARSGKRVLLLIDSLTRTARAIREIGLAAGEIPVRQGFTSGVYTELPKLLERAGNLSHGSITAFYTLLSSSEHEFDAIGEEVKSLLDGHIILDTNLARHGLRPSIDPLSSISRLAGQLQTQQQKEPIQIILKILQRLKRDRDVVLMGGIPDHELKIALEFESRIVSTLTQPLESSVSFSECLRVIRELANSITTALATKT